MGMNSKIEWTEATWNPVTGCSKVSEGCANCYAERMAKRLAGRFGYPKDDPFRVTFHPDRLDQPFGWRWKEPKVIFVCSMGDLFHESISHRERNQVFEAMDYADRHTYLLLTKRPEIALEFDKWREESWLGYPHTPWKDHIWLGVTAENQRAADERIPILLEIPTAKRFVSIEPMLGPIKLPIINEHKGPGPYESQYEFYKRMREERLDWIIVGGESGPGARPMEANWVRKIRDDCVDTGVPFFFKQWGGVNKKKAGRLLDGRVWDEVPKQGLTT